jgi:hypothetical protein
MATTMLAILVEHHNIGDHAQNGWISHVYNACIRHVKETYDVDITKDNIQKKVKHFKSIMSH